MPAVRRGKPLSDTYQEPLRKEFTKPKNFKDVPAN